MSRWLLMALCLIVSLSARSAQGACSDVPADAAARLQNAMASRQAQSYAAADALLSDLHVKYPESWLISYEHGRLRAMMKEYQSAAGMLAEAAACIPVQLEPQFYNTWGWVLLMLGRYQESLDMFGRAEGAVEFQEAGALHRSKVYNNTGLAYLQLDRYEEAKRYFSKALTEGSELARRNLDIVDSTIRVAENDDPNIPGIFAPVVSSAKATPDRISSMRSRVAKRLGVAEGELGVYLESLTSRYHLVWGANQSYPKARALVKEAETRGIKDAYVASVIEWKDVTSQFPAGSGG